MQTSYTMRLFKLTTHATSLELISNLVKSTLCFVVLSHSSWFHPLTDLSQQKRGSMGDRGSKFDYLPSQRHGLCRWQRWEITKRQSTGNWGLTHNTRKYGCSFKTLSNFVCITRNNVIQPLWMRATGSCTRNGLPIQKVGQESSFLKSILAQYVKADINIRIWRSTSFLIFTLSVISNAYRRGPLKPFENWIYEIEK